MIRGMLIGSVILIVVPSALWIGSTRADDSTRLALIWVAIPIGKPTSIVTCRCLLYGYRPN